MLRSEGRYGKVLRSPACSHLDSYHPCLCLITIITMHDLTGSTGPAPPQLSGQSGQQAPQTWLGRTQGPQQPQQPTGELSLQEQAILANIQELQRQLWKVKMEQEKRETEELKAKAKKKQVRRRGDDGRDSGSTKVFCVLLTSNWNEPSVGRFISLFRLPIITIIDRQRRHHGAIPFRATIGLGLWFSS